MTTIVARGVHICKKQVAIPDNCDSSHSTTSDNDSQVLPLNEMKLSECEWI